MNRKVIYGLILAAVTSAAVADDKIPEGLAKTLQKSMPGLSIDSLRATPIPGMFELVSGGEVAYVSADGNHMIQGTLYNVPKRKNLTENSLSIGRQAAMKTLDAGSLIVYPAKGEVKHTITVFTDPSCPYCLRLHEELPKLNEMGVTVKYALYARNGGSTLTARQLNDIVCASEQKAELDKYFASPQKAAKGDSCKKAEGLERIAAIAQQVGMKGTPHIVTDTGFAISGFQPAAELVRTIEQSK